MATSYSDLLISGPWGLASKSGRFTWLHWNETLLLLLMSIKHLSSVLPLPLPPLHFRKCPNHSHHTVMPVAISRADFHCFLELIELCVREGGKCSLFLDPRKQLGSFLCKGGTGLPKRKICFCKLSKKYLMHCWVLSCLVDLFFS